MSSCWTSEKGVDMEDCVGAGKPQIPKELSQKILERVLTARPTNRPSLTKAIHKAHNEFKPPTAMSLLHLLRVYREECAAGVYTLDPAIEELLQTKSFRSQSGVLVIAVFTSPYPETAGKKQAFSCEYDCYYCPAEPNQPRSYLKSEPGVARANMNAFDPVLQFRDRARQYERMGHPVDKIELLVLGGTWSSYPRDYQTTFIRDVFYAANTWVSGGVSSSGSEDRPKESVEAEIRRNETAACRIIGLTLETRPDRVTVAELQRFRQLGVTRIQMGVQHTDERILHRINRRCTSDIVKRAIRLAKDCCFKVDIHLMPDLPQPLKPGIPITKNGGIFDPEDIDWDFSVLEADKKMFETVIYDPDWQADQWKIYPCEVTQWTRIEEDYKRGSYKPYGHQTNVREITPLFELLIDVMSQVRPWVRLNRVIRDIPSHEILAGNLNVSMRDTLDVEMARRGLFCMDIRNREVKKREIDLATAILRTRQYESSGGMEYFLSFESEDEKVLFGFLRLRISDMAGKAHVEGGDPTIAFPELNGAALIRELHVYGQVKKVNQKKGERSPELLFNSGSSSNFAHHGVQNWRSAQHNGFGKRLLALAEQITRQEKREKIAVISGVGVKEYYRKSGYRDEGLFMTKYLTNREFQLLPFIILFFLFLLVVGGSKYLF